MPMVEVLEQIDRFLGAGRLSWPRRVLVAMSGGVDSTFAAWLAKRAGAEVIGIHFHLGDFGPDESGVARCCSLSDARDARRMADLLEVPLYVVNVAAVFEREVIKPFVEAYARGLTPNPCVLCNPRIKWRFLIQKAKELEAPAVVTGHYARVLEESGSGRILLKGLDDKKDQSYFLTRLSSEQLAWALLPVGWFDKSLIREALAAAGFSVFKKPESQDVCFIGPGGYAATIAKYLGERTPPPGEIVDQEGKVLGRHRGIHHFTVGQRKGAGVAGPAPLYVLAIDPVRGRIVLGPKPETFSAAAMITDLHWFHRPPAPEEDYEVKIRYKSPPASARVELLGPDSARINFMKPQRAVAPGQAAVIYHGDEVLGGGFFAPGGGR